MRVRWETGRTPPDSSAYLPARGSVRGLDANIGCVLTAPWIGLPVIEGR
jgi:hypothetical protein